MRQWAGQMTKISEKREANKVGLAITPAFCLERVSRLHCRIGEDWEWEERGLRQAVSPSEEAEFIWKDRQLEFAGQRTRENCTRAQSRDRKGLYFCLTTVYIVCKENYLKAGKELRESNRQNAERYCLSSGKSLPYAKSLLRWCGINLTSKPWKDQCIKYLTAL